MKKFGVREICDVVLKAKAPQKIGTKIFYKDEPVVYFDTLKTSSLEGAATTVYATGGRGNSRLMAWEGERTITFTMEDALISPTGFMILSGAGLVEANKTEGKNIYVHRTVQTVVKEITVGEDATEKGIILDDIVYQGDKSENWIYITFINNPAVTTEPFIPTVEYLADSNSTTTNVAEAKKTKLTFKTTKVGDRDKDDTENIKNGDIVLVDYYIEKTSGVKQIEITPDKFGGNYYLEASTLFRDTNGVDLPAEFIIPNCKIQSNFTFSMASTGDPSTFTFTMDAFPDYTRFDKTKKVLAAIQIIDVAGSTTTLTRKKTESEDDDKFE